MKRELRDLLEDEARAARGRLAEAIRLAEEIDQALDRISTRVNTVLTRPGLRHEACAQQAMAGYLDAIGLRERLLSELLKVTQAGVATLEYLEGQRNSVFTEQLGQLASERSRLGREIAELEAATAKRLKEGSPPYGSLIGAIPVVSLPIVLWAWVATEKYWGRGLSSWGDTSEASLSAILARLVVVIAKLAFFLLGWLPGFLLIVWIALGLGRLVRERWSREQTDRLEESFEAPRAAIAQLERERDAVLLQMRTNEFASHASRAVLEKLKVQVEAARRERQP